MNGARSPADTGPVLVGVDGSHDSDVAVELAVWEAERRRVPLVLAHGFTEPGPSSAYGWIPHGSLFASALRDQARTMLTELQQRVQAQHPTVSVRSTMVAGGGAGALVELSSMAGLVVVGSRGRGGFAGLSVGSVSSQVAAHAHSPVIVARPAPNDESAPPLPGPVVVGVDGSAESTDALTFALDEARIRDVPVTAIFAWWEPPAEILAGLTDPEQAQAEAEQLLADIVAGPASKFPDVEVVPEAAHELNAARTLVEASSNAGLMVVGSRGRGGFASLLLGSVSRAVLGHARCPVAIVRRQP